MVGPEANFCLEVDVIINTNMSLNNSVSCVLVDHSVPQPISYSISITKVLKDGTYVAEDKVHLGAVNLDLKGISKLLLQENPEVVSVEVTCSVSNKFGNDSKTTTIIPCGNVKPTPCRASILFTCKEFMCYVQVLQSVRMG